MLRIRVRVLPHGVPPQSWGAGLNRRREQWGNRPQPMGAAAGDGPGAMTRVAAGLAGPIATRRLVACSGPVRTSERCLLGDRSDQRPIEAIHALADVRGRIEPLTTALRRDLIMRTRLKALTKSVPRDLSVARFIVAALVRDHGRSRWRRCLKWPHATSGSPQLGANPNQPSQWMTRLLAVALERAA
jgi:hypothetical protein